MLRYGRDCFAAAMSVISMELLLDPPGPSEPPQPYLKVLLGTRCSLNSYRDRSCAYTCDRCLNRNQASNLRCIDHYNDSSPCCKALR